MRYILLSIVSIYIRALLRFTLYCLQSEKLVVVWHVRLYGKSFSSLARLLLLSKPKEGMRMDSIFKKFYITLSLRIFVEACSLHLFSDILTNWHGRCFSLCIPLCYHLSVHIFSQFLILRAANSMFKFVLANDQIKFLDSFCDLVSLGVKSC